MTASSRFEADQAQRPVAVINKPHDDVLGHSCISSCRNLGAGTNTSDPRNNYSPVSIETAKRVMARRKVEMSAAYEKMFLASAGESV